MTTISALMQLGRTAVVTGASSGIGKAACLRFAGAGMHVFAVDIDETELQVAIQEIQEAVVSDSQKIFGIGVDVSNLEAVMNLADVVFLETGGCHVLMNNAGIGLGGGALTDMEVVQKVMGVNVNGPVHGCLAFVDRMKTSHEPGIVINTYVISALSYGRRL